MRKLCAVCQEEYRSDLEECPVDGGQLLSLQEEADDPLIGQTVDGRYVVQSMLGSGGMGSVYKAHQKTMDRAIALKVLRQELSGDPQTVKRFLREVKAVSVLKHPNTITVYDFGQTPNNLLYIAMELLEGRPLTSLIAEEGLSVERALRMIMQCCSALSEAHDKGVVHRDLKPDNIMLTELGAEGDHVKVLDFGIAKLTSNQEQTQLTRSGLTVGTPPYMSPEQAEGREDIDFSTDLYSLGCILFECLTGRPPYVSDSPVKVLMAHCTGDIPSVASVNSEIVLPEGLQELLYSLLGKEPEDRPASAKQLRESLALILEGRGAELGLSVPVAPVDPRSTTESSSIESQRTETVKLGSGTTTETEGEAISSELLTGEIPTRSSPMLPLVVLGTLLTVLGLFAFDRALPSEEEAVAGDGVQAAGSGDSDKDKPAVGGTQEATSPTAAAAPPEEAERFLWLRSTPAGAEVWRGKKIFGATPVKLKVHPTEIQRMVVKLKGYQPMQIAVDPGMRDDLSLQLQRVTPTRATRRRPPKASKKKKAPRKSKPLLPVDAMDDDDEVDGLK